MKKETDYIRRTLSPAARYSQLAEECMELGQVACKLAREAGIENPPRKLHWQLVEELTEEIADVINCLSVIDDQPHNEAIMIVRRKKMERWAVQIAKLRQKMMEEAEIVNRRTDNGTD